MTATEQLFVAKEKLAYVQTCLNDDLEVWEIKEYRALKLDYEAEIQALETHIRQNEALFPKQGR